MRCLNDFWVINKNTSCESCQAEMKIMKKNISDGHGCTVFIEYAVNIEIGKILEKDFLFCLNRKLKKILHFVII